MMVRAEGADVYDTAGIMCNGACIGDSVDRLETVPGRCVGVLFQCLERHFIDLLIFFISLLLIVLLALISLALCA